MNEQIKKTKLMRGGEKLPWNVKEQKKKIVPRPKASCWVDDGINYNEAEEKAEGEDEDGWYSASTWCFPGNMQNGDYTLMHIHLYYYWSNTANLWSRQN